LIFIFNIKKSALALSGNISLFNLFCSFVLIKKCANFSSLKKIIEKIENRKNNRKRTAIISHQQNFNYRKKNRIHWSRSLSHRIIASHLACVTIIAKCLLCDAIAIPVDYYKENYQTKLYATLIEINKRNLSKQWQLINQILQRNRV